MLKPLILAMGLLSAADATAQSHHAGLPQQPRFHSVRLDFECTSSFKVRSVRLIMESSEKGTRYANRLKSISVNEKALGDKDVAVVQKIIDQFNTIPQAGLMCSEDRASLYIGPEYRKIGYRNGKFIPAPHVVDILRIRPEGVSLEGQMAIAK